MEPLQLIALETSNHARRHLHDSLPGAPRVPYQPNRRVARTGLITRTQIAGLLRRTADRVDPCAAAT
jgi:hypothetical protein